jgi:C4-dicarboxylate-specific signal transduction histidine kinase
MGRRRLDAALARRSQERQLAPKQTQMSFEEMNDAINSVPLESRESLRRIFSRYQRSRDSEVENLRQEIQLYRTLSTAGITASVFAHESSGNPMKIITLSLKSIERRSAELLGDQYYTKLQGPVNEIKEAIKRLAVLSSATLGLLQHEKRRIGHVDVHRVVRQVTSTLKPFIDGRDVDLDFVLADSYPYLRGSEAALESIVTNLINNSLVAFEEANVEQRRILIETSVQDLSMQIRVMDNGPGIIGINVKDVWLPGQTTRKNGTGLGLTIVRDTVIDLGGKVHAISHGSLGGAEITIELPILGK